MTICCWTRERKETRGAVFKKQQFITVCYSTSVRIEMKQEGQFSKKKLIYYSMLFNLCAYWNETRGTVFKKQLNIYYCMIFNLCANWNETRGTVFNKKKHKFITVCYSTCVRIEMKQEGYFSKKIQLMTICCWTSERKETRGAVFKKQQFITVCYSTCVRIEMKQEGQFLKKNKRGSFHKFITVCYSTCVRIEMKQEGQFSTKKTQIYYSMLFNLCAYWNETRGSVFKKNHKLMTICCWTCERIEMKQEGQFSTKKHTILLQYAIQLVCILKWNKRGSFQKKSNWWQYATELMCEKKQEGQFTKNNNLLQYAIQLVCVLKWNKRDSFQKKPQIYYSMLFNLCANWNETRGTVFKKKHKFITVCYLTCVRIEMKQEGQFSTKKTKIYYIYAIQLVCLLKWNKRGSFQKNPIDDNMLLNSWRKETRRAVFKKQQFITVCYSTCVHIEMKQEGQFLKKNTNLLQYAI